MKKLIVTVNGVRFDVEVEVVEDDEYNLPTAVQMPTYKRTESKTTAPLPTSIKTIKKEQKTVPTDKKTITSPINGVVIEVPIKVGQLVQENEILVTLEAMKMKTNVTAPFSGVVKEIHVKPQDAIEPGQALVTFE